MPSSDENLTGFLEDKFWDIRNYVSSHITSMKEQCKKDYESEIQSLKRENHELRENIKTKTEYLSGKDMELEALRRQLNCFINKKPLCSTCSQRIGNDTQLKEEFCKTSRHLSQHDSAKLSQKESQRLLAAAKKRKRMQLDSSSSSIGRPAPLPNQKRRRIDINHSWQKKEQLNPDSQKSNSQWLSKKANDPPLMKKKNKFANRVDAEEDVTKKECDSTLADVSDLDTERTLTDDIHLDHEPRVDRNLPDQSLYLHVNNLSPPSVKYDASLAIRNAINSKDLANLEDSYYGNLSDSSLSSVAVAGKTAQAYRQKKLIGQGSDNAMPPTHGVPVYKSADVAVKHRLKQSKLNLPGAGFRNKTNSPKIDLVSLKKGSTVSTKTKNFQDLDETTLDFSEKSSKDDLTIGCSPSVVKSKAPSVISTKVLNQPTAAAAKSKKLPKVGGSPTETEFKRPCLPMKNYTNSPVVVDQNKVSTTFHSKDKVVTASNNSQQDLDMECSDPLASSTLKFKDVIDRSGNSPPTQFFSSTMVSESDLPNCATLGASPGTNLASFPSAVFPAGDYCEEVIKGENHRPGSSKSKKTDNKKDSPNRGHKYNTVERKKEERMKLPGHFCYECQAYYKGSGLTDEQIEAKMTNCSRHRAQYRIPSTPDGFWSLDINSPSTYDKENIKSSKTNDSPSAVSHSKSSSKEQQALGSKGSRRRRPLNFPPNESTDGITTSGANDKSNPGYIGTMV